MKKRTFFLLLFAILLIAASSLTVSAEAGNGVYEQAVQMTKNGVFSTGDTVSAECPVCEKTVSWTVLPSIGSTMLIENGGHYYLASDVSNLSYYHFYKTSCLHLNGHNITSSARAIYAETGSTLNIMGDGTVTGNGLSHDT